MASVKSVYGKRTQHRFLPDAVNQIQDDDPESAGVVIIGPLTGGEGGQLGNEDDKILNTTGLPEKISGKVEVFNIRKDEIERRLLMVNIEKTSDGEDSDVEPAPAKKQKKRKKKKS